jgi:L-amino acid N-acyltransferase YncA
VARAAADLKLRDGSELLIRPIRAGDREEFVRSFDHLSEETRYRRFLGPVRRLTEDQVTYFTAVDHRDHEALIALVPTSGEIVGVARYIRLQPGGPKAEVAVTVADEWQHRGVGYALLERLIDRARSSGVHEFQAFCFAGNADIQQLLREQSSAFRAKRSGAELEIETELPPAHQHGAWLRNGLRLAAHAFHRSSAAR